MTKQTTLKFNFESINSELLPPLEKSRRREKYEEKSNKKINKF